MRHLTLELDEPDYRSVQEAIARRQGFQVGFRPPLPDGEGNMAGRIIAEICRGWLEHIDDEK